MLVSLSAGLRCSLTRSLIKLSYSSSCILFGFFKLQVMWWAMGLVSPVYCLISYFSYILSSFSFLLFVAEAIYLRTVPCHDITNSP